MSKKLIIAILKSLYEEEPNQHKRELLAGVMLEVNNLKE